MSEEEFPLITYEQLAVIKLECAERLVSMMSYDELKEYVTEQMLKYIPNEQVQCLAQIQSATSEEFLDQLLKDVLGENYKEVSEKTLTVRRKSSTPLPEMKF